MCVSLDEKFHFYIHINRCIYINRISPCESYFPRMKTIKKRLFNWFFVFIKQRKIAIVKITDCETTDSIGSLSLFLSSSPSLSFSPYGLSPAWICVCQLQRETVCRTLLYCSFLKEPTLKTVTAKRTWPDLA